LQVWAGKGVTGISGLDGAVFLLSGASSDIGKGGLLAALSVYFVSISILSTGVVSLRQGFEIFLSRSE
jgi:hypothetical protein